MSDRDNELVPRAQALDLIARTVTCKNFDPEAWIKAGPPYIKPPIGPVAYLPPKPCLQ